MSVEVVVYILLSVTDLLCAGDTAAAFFVFVFFRIETRGRGEELELAIVMFLDKKFTASQVTA